MIDITRLVKAPTNKHSLPFLGRKYYNGIISFVNGYNRLIRWLGGGTFRASGSAELDEIRQHSQAVSDISDHLETLFTESLLMRPKLIIELGVGPGESTFALERVAKLSNATLVSVDVNEKAARASAWKEWIFIHEDDVEFARRFESWAQERNISPSIDVLFIDTSHTYEHSLKEIEHWFPYLSDRAKVFFHDTNTGPIYRRKGGSIGIASDIQRGVIRALEQYFQVSFNEKKDFMDIRSGWLIQHHSLCNGFTILKKIV